VEKASPQTMLAATGPHSSDLPASPKASENSPAMVVPEVIRMAITRRRAAYSVACRVDMPAVRRALAASISTMAALTAIPVSAITPYNVYSDSGLPDTSRPRVNAGEG